MNSSVNRNIINVYARIYVFDFFLKAKSKRISKLNQKKRDNNSNKQNKFNG